ncbi:REP-associated tyrosine transposase [Pseudomonas sp. R11F]|uniref:Transposase n=1 Tax=Pseudomonas palleroniana TaxID=191390 RepID=A0A1H5NBI0_9PSED|nr:MULTISPECIES: transposase [Pseudomonas]KAB0569869.1 transposase [Pseudomonas palleroniana]MBM9484902.1 transposase [Pseudomonas sp. ICBG1301]PTC31390.1 transposase [Pseudomonas palleroniana]SEE98933.1 REP element-mobilizing transposase RayT [Pseudomonas palleroniana]
MRPTPQTHRLRHGRYSEHGRSYLITIVVHQRQQFFTDLFLGRLLVAELRQVHELGLVDSMAWVIMPDHIHWLFELKQQTLADVVRRIKSRSTLTINRYRQSKERVWQPGYYDRAVRVEDDVRTMARYIVANPLRAGLVERVGDYSLWDAAWL